MTSSSEIDVAAELLKQATINTIEVPSENTVEEANAASNRKAMIPPPCWNNGRYKMVEMLKYLETLPEVEQVKVLRFITGEKEGMLMRHRESTSIRSVVSRVVFLFLFFLFFLRVHLTSVMI